MGCITSKEIARSMSIRKDLSHGFQSTPTWEELLISKSGNDYEHLFAFVRSNNTITTKLRTSSFTISDINGTVEDQSSPDGVEQPDFSRFTRSKSCQMVREKLSPENKLDLKDKNLAGSRSFHTVEEYDDLLERIHKFENYYSCEDVKSLLNSEDEEGSSSLITRDIFENADRRETGWKRKALAKGLESLDVSSNVEFPAIARFKQRINIHVDGEVYSPGTYITPKFGSYNDPAGKQEKKCEGNSVFSPQLVAAFEDCMQQLQLEEDNILRHMKNGHSQPDED